MKKVIRINIKEYNDFTHPYFLATSPDVYGFLVQGNSVKEVMELAPEVLHDFLEETEKLKVEKKVRDEKKSFQKGLLDFSNTIIMKYCYESSLTLQPH
jgi:predicted RNase H-like HicB family nuclease